jgi:glycosyltransferase involved in cell wall biosynthesis
MKRISFIMPTFNRAHFIGESLQSILTQMSSNDELVVIDDGSSDQTECVVRSVAPDARYMRQVNAGKSAALNCGLENTDSEYVWICDDDDLLRPGVVKILHELLSASGAGFIFGKYTRFCQDDSGRRVDLGTGYWPDLKEGSLVRHILEDAFPMQNASLVRRTSYQKTGAFDEQLLRSIDYDMFVRLALNVEVEYVNQIIFDQRKHDGVRGPQRALHDASESMRVWLEYDRYIFDRIAEYVPLAMFEEMFEGTDSSLIRRAGLLQRACIWARHQRWSAAVADLRAAALLDNDRPLHFVERAICRRLLNGKHGFDGALTPQVASAIRMVGLSSKSGSAICSEMALGALWMLRRGHSGKRYHAARMMMMMRSFGGSALYQQSRAVPDQRDYIRLRERKVTRPWETRDG